MKVVGRFCDIFDCMKDDKDYKPSLLEQIRYGFLPYVKVRGLFLWWTIRYGGAKNIPPELLIKRMEKNIERTRESLQNALRAMPDDTTKEERDMLFKAIHESEKLERIYRDGLKKD